MVYCSNYSYIDFDFVDCNASCLLLKGKNQKFILISINIFSAEEKLLVLVHLVCKTEVIQCKDVTVQLQKSLLEQILLN